jgi:hypothetical protein
MSLMDAIKAGTQLRSVAKQQAAAPAPKAAPGPMSLMDAIKGGVQLKKVDRSAPRPGARPPPKPANPQSMMLMMIKQWVKLSSAKDRKVPEKQAPVDSKPSLVSALLAKAQSMRAAIEGDDSSSSGSDSFDK